MGCWKASGSLLNARGAQIRLNLPELKLFGFARSIRGQVRVNFHKMPAQYVEC